MAAPLSIALAAPLGTVLAAPHGTALAAPFEATLLGADIVALNECFDAPGNEALAAKDRPAPNEFVAVPASVVAVPATDVVAGTGSLETHNAPLSDVAVAVWPIDGRTNVAAVD